MADREQYTPGPAGGARIERNGENWTLVLVRELRHPPEKVWQALTDPAHLREWAPFDADKSLGTAGTTVKLTTVGAPSPQVSETTVIRADAPKVLEYNGGATKSDGSSKRWMAARASPCGTTSTVDSSRWGLLVGISASTSSSGSSRVSQWDVWSAWMR